MQALYAACAPTAAGQRDRAMLALYYGCGLRASEGLRLEVKDLDLDKGLLLVTKTKTYRPRYVPLSEAVRADLEAWLTYGRPRLLKGESEAVLIHTRGAYREASDFNRRLQKLLHQGGISRRVTLHGLRHSVATHLLENGMALSYIAAFLGHQSLEVTQHYTHLSYPEDEGL
ncbi:MAG: phage integrase family protein [Bacteroidia bacterium]|nr:phage integrase family protein [Bacteroidia bacterium]